MAESVNGLYKTELIRRQGSWRHADHVELGTLTYIDWFNQRRLHSELGDIPPAEFEADYYARPRAQQQVPTPTRTRCKRPAGSTHRTDPSAQPLISR